MHKITLKGFANNFDTVQAPTKWVAKKTAVAWANGPSIRSAKQGGSSVAEIADSYAVSIPTIYKILKASAPVHSLYRAELVSARKDRDNLAQRLVEAEAQLNYANNRLTILEESYEGQKVGRKTMEAQRDEARHDLANAQLNEAAAIARLNDPSIANKWQNEAHQEFLRREEAEADRARAEEQITMMSERLAECRGRGFWARLFNR